MRCTLRLCLRIKYNRVHFHLQRMVWFLRRDERDETRVGVARWQGFLLTFTSTVHVHFQVDVMSGIRAAGMRGTGRDQYRRVMQDVTGAVVAVPGDDVRHAQIREFLQQRRIDDTVGGHCSVL